MQGKASIQNKVHGIIKMSRELMLVVVAAGLKYRIKTFKAEAQNQYRSNADQIDPGQTIYQTHFVVKYCLVYADIVAATNLFSSSVTRTSLGLHRRWLNKPREVILAVEK